MITVKAIYEDGSIKLLEDAPLQEQQHLLITLMDDNVAEEKIIRQISLQQPDSFRAYLADEREDLYQDYLKFIK